VAFNQLTQTPSRLVKIHRTKDLEAQLAALMWWLVVTDVFCSFEILVAESSPDFNIYIRFLLWYVSIISCKILAANTSTLRNVLNSTDNFNLIYMNM
jgi:hypothetical protein